MKILFDTNVVLDLLLKRAPFAASAARLFAHVERGRIQGILGATTITTLYYLTAKVTDRTTATASIRALIAIFDIAPVTRFVIENALAESVPDFEDAVLYEAGKHWGVDGVVTRNEEHFQGSGLTVYTPPELLAYLRATDEDHE
jgi:predicted nucleic acid-binding protein